MVKRRNVKINSISTPEEVAKARQNATVTNNQGRPQIGATFDPSSSPQELLSQRQKLLSQRKKVLEGENIEKYNGPAVPFQHNADTKAINAQEIINNGGNYPADPPVKPIDEDPPFASIEDLPDGFRRVNPPSGCIFYDFDSIGIRVLTPEEAILVTGACQSNDIIGLHDVLNATITRNIRDLWWTDYLYVIFWHRLFSYAKLPYKITWTSIYGNERSDEINATHLTNTTLKITKEQWQEYKALGFAPTTVSTAEELLTYDFKDNNEKFRKWLRAQYLQGNTIDEKLSNLKKLDMESLIKLKEFTVAINDIGMQEFIRVCDVDLNKRWDESLLYLQKQWQVINIMTEENSGFDDSERANLLKTGERIKNELVRLSNSKPGEAEPLLETIKLSINELTFLPRL